MNYTIKIYVHKYVSDYFFKHKDVFFMTDSKWFVSYFHNYNKKLYNKFKFLKN